MLLDLAIDLGGRHFADAQRIGDVLEHALVAVERVVLEHHADAAEARRHVGDVLAVDLDAAARWRFQPGEQAAGGRLARARGSEQNDELAEIEVEVRAGRARSVPSAKRFVTSLKETAIECSAGRLSPSPRRKSGRERGASGRER